MHIQALGSPVTLKLDDRPVQAADHAAVQASAKAADSAAAAPSREQVSAALKRINASMAASSQSLEFSIDDDSKHTVVKIIDQATREVVRQIPSAEALDIAKSLDKMMGLLISQKA
jgi:flagellar protein FlaG